MKIEIEPCSKPRMTRADKWKRRRCVLEYWAFCDELRFKLGTFKLGDCYKITFSIPFPKSYGAKRRALLEGKPHKLKPDLDNLLKAFQDALLEDDSVVHEIHARKIWGEAGFIEVENLGKA